MAVVALKSKFITNRDAKTMSNSFYSKAQLMESIGLANIASGDSVGSTYRIAQIPSNARVSDILISSPDIGTTTTADVGLYKTTDDGGAVVDADFFIAAKTLKDGALVESQVAFSNVMTLTLSEKMIWELLGLSADPGIMYDVALTLTGDADAAGVALVKVRYTQ